MPPAPALRNPRVCPPQDFIPKGLENYIRLILPGRGICWNEPSAKIPNSAPAHAALSEAWRSLGYHGKSMRTKRRRPWIFRPTSLA